MKTWTAVMALALIGCASSNASDAEDASVGADAGVSEPDAPTGDGFGSECMDHSDCESGLCYQPDGDNQPGTCTEECPDGRCPDGYACRDVLISDFSDARVCVEAEDTMCDSCDSNAACGDSGDFCIGLTGGNFCTIDCSGDPNVCPAGFTCQTVAGTGDTVVGMQCMPTNGVCCVDGDGDLRGDGSGCVTTDCDDDNAAVYDDAAEVCDGYDNDCVGGVDVDPTDCATASCQLGALGYFERAGEPCETGACTPQSATLCGLYTCSDGDENGDSCAVACDVEDDGKCIPSAHCDASVCYSDLADGLASDEDSDCESAHSQNGFCCPAGDCCSQASDCPTFGTIAPICDNPTTCQGTRGEAVCTASYTCASNGTVQDDSACDSSTRAGDCGWYLDVYCTGDLDQTAPSCATSCNSDADCDAGAYCNDQNECVEDEDDGGMCDDGDGLGADECKSDHCQNGFCCSGGDCCQSESDCPGSYSTPPSCTTPTACQGEADVAQCLSNVCSTSVGVDDDSACGSGTLASDCGFYRPIYCDGNSTQTPPVCPSSCTSDSDCDANAYCNGAGACVGDQPDGGVCSDADGMGAAECQSGYCGNGYCCSGGDCCATNGDCDPYDVVPDCDDATSCQGSRVDGVCNVSNQCVAQAVDDDTACGGLEAADCGPYPAVYCTSMPNQSAPTCSSSCTDDNDCDVSAHCDAGECVPDTGQGGFCDEPSDCGSGLSCVDGVCCNSACNGGCEACDLPGSVGTCTAVPDGQDPDNECGAIDCGSYYWGWGGTGGNTCYERADVPAATASCNGSRQCRSAAIECPSAGQGAAVTTCDDFCQNPTGGTCSGTTAGSCSNVDQGNQTCGNGVCQVTEPRCVNGSPNTCTPNWDAQTTETCNNVDDNCDGSIDNGSFSDSLEPNNSCSSYKTLPTVGSNQSRTENTRTIYGSGDNDYYKIRGEETDSSCSCCDTFCFDEDYRLTVTLSVPSGAGSYFLCTGTSCGGVNDYCVEVLAGDSNGWAWKFDGGCPGSDSDELYVRVYGDNAPGYECLPYTLTYRYETGCF